MCGVGSQGQTKHTHLGPHDLRQCGDELRRRVEVLGDDLLIDHLADGVPQRLRECLCHLRVRAMLPRTGGDWYWASHLLAVIRYCVGHGEYVW